MFSTERETSCLGAGEPCRERRFTAGLLLQLAGVFVLLVSYALPWIDMRPLASSTISGFGVLGFTVGLVRRFSSAANVSETAMAFDLIKAFCLTFTAPILAVIGGVCALRCKPCGRLLMALAGAYFLGWCGYDFIRHGFSFKATQLSGVVGVIASLALAVPYLSRFKQLAKISALGEMFWIRVPVYASNVAVAGMVVFLLGGIGVANINMVFSSKPDSNADSKPPSFEKLFNKPDAPPPPPPLALGQPAHSAPGISVPQRLEPPVREFVPVVTGGDPVEAENLYRQAEELAKRGNDYEAARLYQRSAEIGFLDAQVEIAARYDFGKGVPQNSIRAAGWYRYAAERGDSFAQYAIGQMYRDGEGVPKDVAKGIDWIKKSAQQGDRDGLFELAKAYEDGDGVERDYPNAYELYLDASEKGNDKATQRLKSLELKLSEKDREILDERLASREAPQDGVEAQ